ncbi:MAG: hypothetical protein ABSH19_02190 [Opitutales bacterium]|jgi:hypothetical protein
MNETDATSKSSSSFPMAWASVLLTLDEADFAKLLGREFYGLEILRPADFFSRQRAAGQLQPA